MHSIKSALLCATALVMGIGSPALGQEAAPQEKVQDWGSFGVQTQYVDPGIKPGDDFHGHVSGKWLATAEIPADRTETGGFIDLRDLSEVRMRRIMEDAVAAKAAPGTPQARIAAGYKAFMDTAAIEAAGMTPAYPMLTRIYSARTPDDLAALFADPSLASPLSAHVTIDSKNSGYYALYIGQSELGLPDRNYYLVDSPENRDILAKYREYLTTILGAAGYADAAAASDAVIALEKKMAAANWDRALARNRDLTYDKLSVDQFAALAPQAPLRRFLEAMTGNSLPSHVVATRLPPTSEELAAAKFTPEMTAKLGGGIPALAGLISSEPIPTWQAWLASRFLTSKASVLPARIDDAHFAFFGKLLNGQQEQRARWKRAIAAVEGQVGELAGQVYAERHFPATHKAEMEKLVGNLRLAMAENLKSLAWMSPTTRAAAKEKLDLFTAKIGYPDKYKTYDGLELTADSAFANSLAADRWERSDDVARLAKPVDRSEWLMLPQTVNAYYMPPANEIAFPAAILQPPFFSISADPAVNYGAIGGVIGHEIGHGFDDQGSKSDGRGNLRNWWTAEDRAAFDKLGNALVEQYNAFCPFDAGKTCVNGRLTLGENIGDLGGLSLAYRAYKMSLGGKEAPVIDGYTGDQRFFMAWAQAFRSKTREASARRQLQTDPHSPDEYRINGIVRNFDEWYKAFNVKPGDKLYLEPEKRLRIW